MIYITNQSKDPICGIYIIINKIDGRVYVGQSKDIAKRFREHIYHKNATELSRDIYKYGIYNFTFAILELCDSSLLDEREDYYIRFYRSIEHGYNILTGGQHNIGTSNPNAKLSERDIYEIREAYKNHERKMAVYENYNDKVTVNSFDAIWEGKTWTHIHTDVYTKENLYYYCKGTTIGENSFTSLFTDEEVLNLRKRYINESAKEIFDSLNNRCKYQTLQQILWGRYYSHLPIYDKKNKIWINI